MTALPLPVAVPDDLTLLDEDWAVPCERWLRPLPVPPCDQQAAWVAWTVPCCPERSPVVLLCTGHKDDLIGGESGICMHCGKRVHAVPHWLPPDRAPEPEDHMKLQHRRLKFDRYPAAELCQEDRDLASRPRRSAHGRIWWRVGNWVYRIGWADL
jgi:hypothetical protein